MRPGKARAKGRPVHAHHRPKEAGLGHHPNFWQKIRLNFITQKMVKRKAKSSEAGGEIVNTLDPFLLRVANVLSKEIEITERHLYLKEARFVPGLIVQSP